MSSKTEEYLALAQRTANGLTRYWESWTDYLTTASRLYKYSFPDQLMIYAQRPDATACADYDVWNNRMNRYVRRGSKGIALLDESSGYPRLHYVFDVSDTGVRHNSRDPERWELNDDLFKPVSDMLVQEYGISHERLSQQLVNIAEKLVNDYWDNNSNDIKKIQKDLEAKQKELDDLKAETILVIRGVSALDKELLGTLVAEARETLETLEKQLVQAQEEYEEATKTAKRSNYICNELFTWADVYDTANHDERRAILQQFIKEIRVRKDYEISITLNASFNQVEQLKSVSIYDGAEIFEGISEKGA